MSSKAAVPFLVSMMLLTGVCNTLLTKYQDNQCVHHCNSKDPKKAEFFDQPVLQTAQMFVGEMGCFAVLAIMNIYNYINGKRSQEPGYTAVDADEHDSLLGEDEVPPPKQSMLKGYRVVLLALPAICDILGTTLMNVGLLLVAPSIYQMVRGALVLFVGLFSVIFLKRRLHLFQWLALGGVVAGVAIVGLAGALWPDKKAQIGSNADGLSDASRAITGVVLIAGAQIFTATQFVLEEWMLEKSSIEPIRVVGWEGVFGFTVTTLTMVVLHLAVGRTPAGQYGRFDMVEGLRQMTTNRTILTTSILIMLSIGGFNFFGLSVTRSVSATSRSTIDTCRTLFIWIVSLALGWERFKSLQVVGFGLLVYATFVFNGLIQPPFEFLRVREEEDNEEEL